MFIFPTLLLAVLTGFVRPASCENLRALTAADLDAQIVSIEQHLSEALPRERTRLSGLYFLKGDRADEGAAKFFFTRARDAADRAIKDDPGAVEAYYWRAMALLGLADLNRGPGAFLDVRAAMRDLNHVHAEDSMLDFSGASRTLGRIYDEAPAWSFLRDRKKSLACLEEAVLRSPEFALNRLYLPEALIHSGHPGEAGPHLRWIIDRAPARGEEDDAEIRTRAASLLAGLGNRGK